MRILILNEYFYPDVSATAQYSVELARALVRAGHEVTAVAGRRDYVSPERQLPRKEIWEGIQILRVSSARVGKTRRWERAAHFASYLLACTWRLLWMRSYDEVLALTTPPLVSVLAALFTRLKGGRLTLWIMDLNPDEAVAAGWLKPRGLAHWFLEHLLRYSLHRAETVVALDRFMRQRVLAKGVHPEKVAVLPPWSLDEAVAYDPEGRSDFRRKHRLEGKFVVMYSGNLSPCHPLDTLLESAERLQGKQGKGAPVVFCFVGGGSELAKVTNFVRTKNLTNVVCLPYQPIERLGASLSAADLHVVVMGSPFVGMIHPCKIYNILKLGVPFLYIGPANSHVTDILPRGAAGDWAHLFSHGDAEGVAACIERCSEAGARRAEEEMCLAREFSSAKLIPRFLALFQTAAGRFANHRAVAPRSVRDM
jgi:glycosyltransferase involved in cell wall biosynthesis